MSSRISVTAALALLALTDVPSVLARVGTESVSKSNDHSMLRRELASVKLPYVDKELVNSVDPDVVQLPKWSDVEIRFLSTASPSPSNASKDEN
mmetsp:Transcript_29016/g.45661  ORF Transcript_29016/g.45661 Transcript_29016/m.45661 type:complete len:94 (+) Transcript_29016:91-372(+)